MKTTFIFFLAIISEVIATASLKASQGFTRLVPAIFVILGYGASFYFLALSLKVIPISLAYAIWSGVGTALTAAIGIFYFREPATTVKMVSLGLIVIGVMGLHSASVAK